MNLSRIKSTFAVVMAALCLLVSVRMAQAQTLIHSTDWTTGTVGSASSGGAGTTTGAGDGWIDTVGGNATASGNLLHIRGDGSFYSDGSYLLRPSSETASVRDQRVVATFPATLPNGSNAYADRYIVLRKTGANTNYLIGIAYSGSTTIQVFANVNGSPGGVGTNVNFSAPSASDILQCTATATGASPTTITVALFDVTTSTTLGTFSATDSTAGLQVAGTIGLGSSTGTDKSSTWSTVATYNMSVASSYAQSLSASSGAVSSPVTITYTPNGNSSATITPAVSGVAGTFSPTTVSFDGSNAAKTVTFTPSAAGTAILSATNSASLTNPSSNTYTSSNAGATSYTLTGPSTGLVSVASSSFTVTPNASYSGTITPAASGVSGTFSPSSLTFSASSVAQTFTFTPTGAGTATISATSSPGLTNPSSLTYTVTSGPVNIAPNNAAFVYSPYNWLVGSGAAKTINAGAYWRTFIIGSTTCVIGLTLGAATPYSEVEARVDQGNWQVYTPSASGAQTWSLTLPTPTTSVKHLVEFVVKSTTETQDRWNTQATAVQFTGLTLDSGSTVAAPALRKYIGAVFGDSITEGVRVNGYTGIANDTDRNDSIADYSYRLCGLLDAEIGIIGFGGSGLTVTGSGNVPPLPSAYNLLWSGQARSFATIPDFVIYNEGTNDSTTATGSAITAVINGIGFGATTANGLSGTRHLVLRPLGATPAANQSANLSAAVTAINSPLVVYGDTTGLFNASDTNQTSDTTHPYANAHIGAITPGIAALAMPLIHPSTGGGGTALQATDTVDGSVGFGEWFVLNCANDAWGYHSTPLNLTTHSYLVYYPVNPAQTYPYTSGNLCVSTVTLASDNKTYVSRTDAFGTLPSGLSGNLLGSTVLYTNGSVSITAQKAAALSLAVRYGAVTYTSGAYHYKNQAGTILADTTTVVNNDGSVDRTVVYH